MKDYSKEKARTMVESMLDETLKEMGGQIDGYVIDSKGFNLSKTQEEFISHFDNNLDKHNEKFYEARVAA